MWLLCVRRKASPSWITPQHKTSLWLQLSKPACSVDTPNPAFVWVTKKQSGWHEKPAPSKQRRDNSDFSEWNIKAGITTVGMSRWWWIWGLKDQTLPIHVTDVHYPSNKWNLSRQGGHRFVNDWQRSITKTFFPDNVWTLSCTFPTPVPPVCIGLHTFLLLLVVKCHVLQWVYLLCNVTFLGRC